MTKKGWIFLIITAILALGVILGGFVFVARDISLRDYDGDKIEVSTMSEIRAYVDERLEGKSMFSFTDDGLISQINRAFPQIRVVSIERTFPDRVKVNIRQRVANLAIVVSGGYLLADFHYQTNAITPIRYIEGAVPTDLVKVEDIDVSSYTQGLPLTTNPSLEKLCEILSVMYDIGCGDYTLPHTVERIDIDYDASTTAIYMEGVGELTALVFDHNSDISTKVLNLLSFYSSEAGSAYREGYILEIRFNEVTSKYEVVAYSRT